MEKITCPSGLIGEIRGLRVRDEDALMSGGVSAANAAMDDLMARCWAETKSPGVYEKFAGGLDKDQKLVPSGMLQGDRMYLLIQLRRITYGNDFDFQVKCSNDFCEKNIHWEFQLSDLEVRFLSKESKGFLLDGNRFPVDLPGCKKKAWFKLLTGRDEKKLAQIRETKKKSISSAILFNRIVEIEGVNRPDLENFILDLEGIDAKTLRDGFEKMDCGVDTTIELNCPACKTKLSVELPLAERFLGQGGPKKDS